LAGLDSSVENARSVPFFAALRAPQPTPEDEFIARLRAGLPPQAAERAIEIYRGHAAKIQ
jgi:hypothetical protein